MTPPQGTPALSPEHPFPGLRPFAFDDSAFFFGRADQIYALFRLIDEDRFVAVVGSSGSGKSSLVRAGLRPLLDEESRDPGGRAWVCREIRPGLTALDRLTDTLMSLSDEADPGIVSALRERVAFDLRRSSFGIVEALSQIGMESGGTLLLIVDQFEELFRYSTSLPNASRDPRREARSRDEAAQFVQLLLEACNTPAYDVRVLITMRSDFIGDCARFQGLPEAVSACQFLVPSLTRDHREQTICEPIKKAGAFIDPPLVERLLNDSGDDLDQLPVLQHCLLRLWERAAKAKAEGDSGEAPDQNDTSPKPRRRLLLEHYFEVGGIDHALSQHADEIQVELSGLEVAIEQVFRALSEVDKEGRATRRALTFAQLLAETGVPEKDLRRVLDRFRADDCSFLTPSRSAMPELAADTKVDVGHEALLRRWEQVSGTSDPELNERRREGWLRLEESDGQNYRVLLGLAKRRSNGQAALSWNQADDWDRWWRSRNRTPAWAERHGGGYDQVRGLLQYSLRKRRLAQAGIAAGVIAGVFMGVLVLYLPYAHRKEVAALDAIMVANTVAAQKATAVATNKYAIASAQKALNEVIALLDNGSLSVAAGRVFLEGVEAGVRNVQVDHQDGELAAVQITLLHTASDVLVKLGESRQALQRVQDAKALADAHLSADPADPTRLPFVYASLWRIGDLLAQQGSDGARAAMEQYDAALKLANALDRRFTADRKWRREIGFIQGKLGDCHMILNDPRKALPEYKFGAEGLRELVQHDPQRADWQRDLASAISRVGQALFRLKRNDEALAEYQAAIDIRKALVAKYHNDAYRSNLAQSHVEMGLAFASLSRFDEALLEYHTSRKIREELSEKDPYNAIWQNYLASLYGYIGDILRRQSAGSEPLEWYRRAVAVKRILALRDSRNPSRQGSLATSAVSLGNLLLDRADLGGALDVYRLALAAREVLVTLLPEEAREKNVAYGRRQLDVFVLRERIGDVLARQTQMEAALQEYRAAAAIAQPLAAESDPAWQFRLAAVRGKLGDAHAAQGRKGEAIEEYRRAIALLEQLVRRERTPTEWGQLFQNVQDKIRKAEAMP